jgi:hypothetical protein
VSHQSRQQPHHQQIQSSTYSPDNLQDFLHDAPVQGLRILCLPDDGNHKNDDSSKHVFQMYYRAYHPIILNMNEDGNSTSSHYDFHDKYRLWNEFIKHDIVSHYLKVQNHMMVSNTQPHGHSFVSQDNGLQVNWMVLLQLLNSIIVMAHYHRCIHGIY